MSYGRLNTKNMQALHMMQVHFYFLRSLVKSMLALLVLDLCLSKALRHYSIMINVIVAEYDSPLALKGIAYYSSSKKEVPLSILKSLLMLVMIQSSFILVDSYKCFSARHDNHPWATPPTRHHQDAMRPSQEIPPTPTIYKTPD